MKVQPEKQAHALAIEQISKWYSDDIAWFLIVGAPSLKSVLVENRYYCRTALVACVTLAVHIDMHCFCRCLLYWNKHSTQTPYNMARSPKCGRGVGAVYIDLIRT